MEAGAGTGAFVLEKEIEANTHPNPFSLFAPFSEEDRFKAGFLIMIESMQ